MGLREKAYHIRRAGNFDKLDNLEDYFDGRILKRTELIELKDEINKRLSIITEKLDRKLLDMQTLFDIGKELNSTLNVSDLVQIITLTLMGQLRICDAAIYFVKDGEIVRLGIKGFQNADLFVLTKELYQILLEKDYAVPLTEMTALKKEFQSLDKANIKLLIPMKGKNGLVGIITLGNKPEGEFYTDEERNFSYALASVSAVAIENANLYNDLRQTNNLLDKKFSELSTLYEVSKVINSSDEYDLVLSLICETISTGFGVKKALIFVREEQGFMIKNTIDLPESSINQELKLSPLEEKLLSQNQTGIIPINPLLREINRPLEKCLFVPFSSMGKIIGGLMVFDFSQYEIEESNLELLNLFAIIASQAAPPVFMTQMVRADLVCIQDPFTPIIDRIGIEIEKARKFGVSVTFCMLKLNNFSKYSEFYGSSVTFQKLENLSRKIKSIIPSTCLGIRYTSNKILIIMPAIPEGDFADVRDNILTETLNLFQNDKEIDIGLDLLSAVFPDNSEDKYTLLTLIE